MSITVGPAVRPGRREAGRQGRGRDLVRLSTTVLLPGPAFFTMGRPGPGLACLALQASLLGWIPAAVWAARATQHLQKQRALAARLRSR